MLFKETEHSYPICTETEGLETRTNERQNKCDKKYINLVLFICTTKPIS